MQISWSAVLFVQALQRVWAGDAIPISWSAVLFLQVQTGPPGVLVRGWLYRTYVVFVGATGHWARATVLGMLATFSETISPCLLLGVESGSQR